MDSTFKPYAIRDISICIKVISKHYVNTANSCKPANHRPSIGKTIVCLYITFNGYKNISVLEKFQSA